MHVGWFDDLTAWLWRAVKMVWQAIVDFVGDLFVMWLEQSLSAILYVLTLLPMPDFMKDLGLPAPVTKLDAKTAE